MNSASLLLIFCFSLISAQNWTNYLKLDPNYEVRWSIQGEWITFQVEVATRGWVGFGISPNGGMTGSDIVIGWVKNGRAQFHDRFADGKFQPAIDESQDWKLLWCCENDTHTSIRFTRLMNTGDYEDLCINPEETVRMIYAYHSDDPNSPSTILYHGTKRRGSRSILLRNNEELFKHYANTEDIHYWDVRSANVLLPEDKDTQYFCTLIKRPYLSHKHHGIEIAPIIQPGNERFVHHMVLYECYVTEDKIAPFLKKQYHECFDKNNFPIFTFCLTPTVGWAVGGGHSYLPNNVGFPIGLPNLVWYLLEVHYDNPGLEKGVVDSSGLRITYTSMLREHDSGTLSIGSLWYPCMFVPPKQEEFTISGHAHPSCLRQRFPPEGIKVYTTLLHSHIIGKRITVRHFRGNRELEPLSRDRNYDFNYQEYRTLPRERTVLPTDHLIVECVYDSSERSTPTYGGISTKEEMCVAFLGYYPRLNMSGALSCPSPSNVLKAMGINEMSSDERFVVSPLTSKNESYFSFLDSYPWNKSSVKAVQRAMKFSPHINFCFDRGGKGIINPILSRYPRVKHFYADKNTCTVRPPQRKPVVEPARPTMPSHTKRPEIRYPPNTRVTTRKPDSSAEIPSEEVPYVLPYPLIEQIVIESG
ncbi:DBH-like monooxygenase protein 1 homolog [Centruroides sculpturatus]|uniref:DBH-like monooxygenase protein 1 homolog n=1 Tax=Centruroides sculpturatus TaxID=218467 RepID=UPI000C6DB326|nr:DBH-like monooxygenase protein 1 homolog [Centruroides sculpturatus]